MSSHDSRPETPKARPAVPKSLMVVAAAAWALLASSVAVLVETPPPSSVGYVASVGALLAVLFAGPVSGVLIAMALEVRRVAAGNYS